MAIFITGTDTNVGKTLVSSWICLHMGISYWKPFQSGVTENGQSDTEVVRRLTSVPVFPEAYRFRDPLSPQAAAAAEGTAIETDKIRLPPKNQLVIEGAGGVLVPLTQDMLLIDLIQKWSFPVIVVARSTLGTINHTCLTLEALRQREIPVLGIIINGPSNAGNKQAIETFSHSSVLAEFPFVPTLTPKALASIPLPLALQTALEKAL